ncbi:hypothetical protein JTA33_19100 [Pseudomonas sp. 20GA0080]|uniref:hypothetical protein n=1 Tax=Pseudomonas alliivorans TaxID=2810613 RepID=UPI001AEB7E65|nr:hypothetical protein [Pseudomonas alliivorans]MBP0952545.1 hypothetical protein [Pseudomonas alliivorans]
MRLNLFDAAPSLGKHRNVGGRYAVCENIASSLIVGKPPPAEHSDSSMGYVLLDKRQPCFRKVCAE